MVWFLLVPGITSSASSTVNCRVNKSIYTAMFRKTLYAKAYWIIPWIWLFCTESKARHPHFSKESFWHKMHCFSQIWHNYFCWYYKLFHFFLPSSSAQHFYLWYKDENRVWGRSIYYWKLEITKGYGVRATTMENENALAPMLCFAQVTW